ncbi:MAG: TonB family protein [Bacteroidota bacterium]
MNQTIKADMTEILFVNRERRYGAYVLRKRYPKVLFFATLIGVLLSSILPLAPLLARMLGYETEVIVEVEEPNDPTAFDPIHLSTQKKSPPPPPAPKLPAPKVKTLAFAIPEPTPDEEVEEKNTIHEQEALKEVPVIGLNDVDGENELSFFEELTEGGLEIPIVVQETGIPGPNDFIVPDEHPRVLNMQEVSQAIGYPTPAQSLGLEGQVVVRVLINETGVYQRHIILNGVHPILEKAVEIHLDKLRFTPAIQGNKPIKFWVNIPFKFQLVK